ncbi:DUF123 domain-containing protein [candidate division KSB1 bacterium]
MNVYFLIIRVKETSEIKIGKLGTFIFPEGLYFYSGSGGKNPEKRVQRHLKKEKKTFWHIDFLLQNKNSEVIKYKIYKNTVTSECALNKKIKKGLKCCQIIDGFGASDCKNECGSHLNYYNTKENSKTVTIK